MRYLDCLLFTAIKDLQIALLKLALLLGVHYHVPVSFVNLVHPTVNETPGLGKLKLNNNIYFAFIHLFKGIFS